MSEILQIAAGVLLGILGAEILTATWAWIIVRKVKAWMDTI